MRAPPRRNESPKPGRVGLSQGIEKATSWTSSYSPRRQKPQGISNETWVPLPAAISSLVSRLVVST